MKIQHNKIVMLGAVLALGCITTVSLSAQTAWISDSDGLWQDSGNWNNGAPASNDVTINNAGAKTVTINNDTPSGNLTISSLTTSVGNMLRLTNTDSTLILTGDHNWLSGGAQIDGGHIDAQGGGYLILNGGTSTMTGGSVNVAQEFWVIGSILNMSGGAVESAVRSRVASFGTEATVNMTGGYFKALSVDVGGNNSVGGLDVSDNGVFETKEFYVDQHADQAAGTVFAKFHDGGTLQLSSVNPYIFAGNGSIITLSNAVLSYRAVSDANLANANLNYITFSGANALRLDSSSNESLASYTFGASNPRFRDLQLTGTNSQWVTTGITTIESGAKLHAYSASNAAVNADLINEGMIQIEGSSVSFKKDVTVTSTGALQGDATGTFDFQKDVTIQSANAAGSDLQQATFRFSGGGNHNLDLTGSSFANDGLRAIGESNFDLGALKIADGNQLTLLGGTDYALYIGLLDLDSRDTGAGLNASLTNAFNLAAGGDIYYDSTLGGNSYLNSQTYDLWGGNGKLIAAVPEASTVSLLLVGVAVCAIVWRRRRMA